MGSTPPRRALDLGVGPPGPGALPWAGACAAGLSEALRALSYQAVPDGRAPHGATGAGLDEAVRRALDQRDGPLIVHLLAQALLDGGTGGLHVVGADNRTAADDIEDWLRRAERGGVLFLLDTCYSGAAPGYPWTARLRAAHNRSFVLAASGAAGPAYDGRLTRATTAVLRQLAAGVPRIDPDRPDVPVAEVFRRIEREMLRLGEVETGGAHGPELHCRVGPLATPFFPNPAHDPARAATVLRDVDRATASLVLEGFDGRDFAPPASIGDDPGVLHRGLLRGRTEEAWELGRFLAGRSGGVAIVSGPRGVGKSALLAALVCAAHPKLRDRTNAVWRPLRPAPALDPFLVAVDARGATVADVSAALARQIGERANAFTVVIDGVDQAARPDRLIAEVLLPMVRENVGRNWRFLIGLNHPRAVAGGGALAHQARIVRLIDAPEDARGLLDDLLAEDPRFADLDTFELRWNLVTAFDPGSFLHATLFAAQILDRWAPADATPESLYRLWERKPPTVPGDLDTAIASAAPEGAARRVLVALAHIGGEGAPVEVVAAVAGLDLPQTYEALRGCRLLIRRDHSADGVEVFRLRHAMMAPVLAGEGQSVVYARLLELAPTWRSADPYLLRHAARHAASAGRLAELLSDPGFLVHADPGGLLDEVIGSALPGAPHVADYLSAVELHRDADPGKRAQILAVAAAGRGDHERAELLLGGRGWRPVAVYDFPGGELVATDGGVVAAAGLDGFIRVYGDDQFVVARHEPLSAIAVAGSEVVTCGTTIMATDLTTGRTRRFGGGSGHWYTGLAVAGPARSGPAADRTLVATAQAGRFAEIWDLAVGERVGTIALDDGERVGAVACTRLGDRPVAVLVSRDGRCHVIDLGTTRPIRTIPLVSAESRAQDVGEPTVVDCAEVGGEPLAVMAARTTTPGVWNLRTGEWVGELRHGGHPPIAAIRCLRVGGAAVVATIAADQTIRIFDLRTRRILEVIELGVEPRALSGSGAGLLTIAGDRVHRIDLSALAAVVARPDASD